MTTNKIARLASGAAQRGRRRSDEEAQTQRGEQRPILSHHILHSIFASATLQNVNS
jgi:hypothetical protein